MFAVVTAIGILLALVLPAIQAARESSRRVHCSNNLKNITLALQNYHDNFKRFPAGAMHSGPNPGGEPPVNAALGPSWWYALLPYFQYKDLWDRIEETQEPGGPTKHEFCANDLSGVVRGLGFPDLIWFDVMRCPSSPLPQSESCLGSPVLPSYVGIAGGCDIDHESPDYASSNMPPEFSEMLAKTQRKYWNIAKGTSAAADGIVTSSGMLPPCRQIRWACCSDGISDTMIVAEQSDWLRDTDPKSARRFHGDPGWTVGGTGAGGGWLSGTRRVDRIPSVTPRRGSSQPWGADCWNITTVRYPPNCKRALGAQPLPGCSENHGSNNPLQSAHPGGLLAGMTDGSVRFISEATDLAVWLRLSIRDDGQNQNLWPLSSIRNDGQPSRVDGAIGCECSDE